VDAVRALDASKASVRDYYIHTYEARPVEWQQDCAGRQISRKDEQIKQRRDPKVKRGKKGGTKKTTEMHQKVKLQEDYQTARVAYANWPCAVFGF